MKSWWNRTLGVLMTVMLVLTLTACGTAEEKKPNETTVQQDGAEQQQQQERQNGSEELKTSYPLTVKDSTGAEFTFEKAPERIVSVSPAETEALFAIGLNEEIIGVSDYDDYPEAATTKPKMGDIYKPNEEAIIAAKPDIVFTGISMNEENVHKFRDLGIKIFKVDPKSYDDVIAIIELYGLITDHQVQAKEVTDHMKQVREDVKAAVADVTEKKKVYLEISPGWTVGGDEYISELVETAGGVNVAREESGWVQINEEHIILSNPDVILYTADLVDFDTQKPLEEIITGRAGWSSIQAVANDQVIGIEENTMSRPGPRLAEGLVSMAKALYPELVK